MNNRIKKEIFSTQILQIVDAALVWLSFVLADFLRDPIRGLLNLETVSEDGLSKMIWVVYVLIPLVPIVLDNQTRFYTRLSRRTVLRSSEKLFRGLFISGVIIGLLTIFAKFGEPRRLILGSGFLISYFLIFARDLIFTGYLRSRVRDERNREHVIIAGNQEEIVGFISQLDGIEAERIKIVGRVILEETSNDDVRKLIDKTATQRVVILPGDTDFKIIAEVVAVCERQGVEAWVGASLLPIKIAQLSFDTAGSEPMLVFRSTPEFSWQTAAKQLVDRIGAFAILLVSSPILLFAWVGIKISSPGASTIFKQERSGLYGRSFWIYKFRTMVPDAESKLEEVKKKMGNEVDGPAFKLNEDPRIFSFGSFLRKFSIDELPQLLNVLKGEMSLVGPRPLPVRETEAMSESAHRRRLSMKPGLTCLWQVSGRSAITDFNEWVDLDVKYIDNWSIWLDVKILLMTIPAVFFGKGAK